MNDHTAERDEVRRILGERLTESELDDYIAARLREDAWRASPWPYAPANHAHRFSRCASGPCAGGTRPCPTKDACQNAEVYRKTRAIHRLLAIANTPEVKAPRARSLWRSMFFVLACWAAIVFVTVATGVAL